MFKIEMLPAAHGDVICIEYGSKREPHHILIDGGPVNAYPAIRSRLAAITSRRKHIDLFVIMHIDTDHIDGTILLLRDESLALTFGDVWFNAWAQLPTATYFLQPRLSRGANRPGFVLLGPTRPPRRCRDLARIRGLLRANLLRFSFEKRCRHGAALAPPSAVIHRRVAAAACWSSEPGTDQARAIGVAATPKAGRL